MSTEGGRETNRVWAEALRPPVPTGPGLHRCWRVSTSLQPTVLDRTLGWEPGRRGGNRGPQVVWGRGSDRAEGRRHTAFPADWPPEEAAPPLADPRSQGGRWGQTVAAGPLHKSERGRPIRRALPGGPGSSHTWPSLGEGDGQRGGPDLDLAKRGPFTCVLRQRRGAAKARRRPREHRLGLGCTGCVQGPGRAEQGRLLDRLPPARRRQEGPLGDAVCAAGG